MPSDKKLDGAEEVIEREYTEEPGKIQEALERGVLESRRKEMAETEGMSKLSEAAVDLVFAFFEASFAIVAVILILLTATTSFALYTTAAGCLLFVAVFEVVRRSIKSVDKFRDALLLRFE